jgi:hypothetical protein
MVSARRLVHFGVARTPESAMSANRTAGARSDRECAPRSRGNAQVVHARPAHPPRHTRLAAWFSGAWSCHDANDGPIGSARCCMGGPRHGVMTCA